MSDITNTTNNTTNTFITLVESHSYKQSNAYFKELDTLCFLSKNLYNSTLFSVRQEYFSSQSYKNYYAVNKEFTLTNHPDYRSLPTKVSKHTQMLVDKNYKSFFHLLKLKSLGQYNKPIKQPKYLDKIKGRQVVFYEKGALSFKEKGFIKLSKTTIKIPTQLTKEQVSFVRIVPVSLGTKINVEVGYKKEIPNELEDNKRYASVDLGINNLMTVSSNVMKPVIYNGKPLKSMNQYYNKTLSKLKKELWENNKQKSSKRIKQLTQKRNNKINDYLHKVSSKLVNQLVEHSINTLVIGKNNEWKQDSNLGKRNNQNFIQIPFTRLIQILSYKCKIKGIKLEIQEESYTSKCSFIDNEEIKKQTKYIGKRIKRGLFKTNNKEIPYINADVNGSLNILKKYLIKKEVWNECEGINNLRSNCIEVSSKPNIDKITIYK